MSDERISENGDSPGQGTAVALTVLPVLPLRNTIVFPGTVVPINVGRASSMRLLEESLPQSKSLALLLQKDSSEDEPGLEGLYTHGIIAKVLRMVRQGEDGVVILVHGESRMRVHQAVQVEPYLKVEVETLESVEIPSEEDHWKASIRNLRESALKLLALRPEVPEEAKVAVEEIPDVAVLTDFLGSNLSIEAKEKQKLIEETDTGRRIEMVQRHLNSQLHIAELQSKLRQDVQSEFTEAQKRA